MFWKNWFQISTTGDNPVYGTYAAQLLINDTSNSFTSAPYIQINYKLQYYGQSTKILFYFSTYTIACNTHVCPDVITVVGSSLTYSTQIIAIIVAIIVFFFKRSVKVEDEVDEEDPEYKKFMEEANVKLKEIYRQQHNKKN